MRLIGILSIAVASLLSGCGRVYLHNPPDFELAKQAQQSFKDAQLGDMLTEERKLMATALQHELEVVRRQTLAIRDAQLVAIIGADAPVSVLNGYVSTRVVELVGGTDQRDAFRRANALVSALIAMDSAREDMQRAAQAYDVVARGGDPALACPVVPGPAPSAVASVFYGSYKAACDTYQAREQDARQAAGGLIGSLNAELVDIDDELHAIERQQAAARTAYEDAKKDYETAQASADASQIKLAAQRLHDALASLDAAGAKAGPALDQAKLGGLGLGGTIDRLKKQRDSIDALLGAVLADGTTGAASQSKVELQVAATLPTLEKDIGQELHPPHVSALVLEAQRLNLELDAVTRRQRQAQAMLVLLRMKREAALAEVQALALANRRLSDAGDCAPSRPFGDDWDRLDGDCREVLTQALLAYANSWSTGRVAEELADYSLIGARHDAALDEAEVTVAQWQNLIEVPLGQLVAVHGGGIKSEDIARLLNAMGVAAVAAGVN